MLACPSAQDFLQAFAKDSGRISRMLLGFYNLECLDLCVASKTGPLLRCKRDGKYVDSDVR
jgi:hypothetical protein